MIARLKLPLKHAQDWSARYDGPEDGSAYDLVVVRTTCRTITLELGDHALADMISDALYYAEQMGPEATGEEDYRPPARTLVRALGRLGVTWHSRRFSVVDIVVPDELRK